jgi:hypothetical protein
MASHTASFRTGFDYDEQQQKVAGLVWDIASLSWVKETQAGGAAGLNLPVYDYASLASGATTDVWTFKSGGTLVATVTINYTDATKATITSVAKT